jgi:hypothetical protein
MFCTNPFDLNEFHLNHHIKYNWSPELDIWLFQFMEENQESRAGECMSWWDPDISI